MQFSTVFQNRIKKLTHQNKDRVKDQRSLKTLSADEVFAFLPEMMAGESVCREYVHVLMLQAYSFRSSRFPA